MPQCIYIYIYIYIYTHIYIYTIWLTVPRSWRYHTSALHYLCHSGIIWVIIGIWSNNCRTISTQWQHTGYNLGMDILEKQSEMILMIYFPKFINQYLCHGPILRMIFACKSNSMVTSPCCNSITGHHITNIFAHVMAAQLPCHVPNCVVIS